MERFIVPIFLAVTLAAGSLVLIETPAHAHGNNALMGHYNSYFRHSNPPGPRGGAGTNWNRSYRPNNQQNGSDANCRKSNPPGPRGGAGTNWYHSNPPGPRGGVGTNWNRSYRSNNPPGPKGGPGSNWHQSSYYSNPPGPRGGAGTNWYRGGNTFAANTR